MSKKYAPIVNEANATTVDTAATVESPMIGESQRQEKRQAGDSSVTPWLPFRQPANNAQRHFAIYTYAGYNPVTPGGYFPSSEDTRPRITVV